MTETQDNPQAEVALDHPTIERLKSKFSGKGLQATVFRGQTTVVTPKEISHDVMEFLRNDPESSYDFLSDVCGVDYLNYPEAQVGPKGRFAVVYNMVSTEHNRRLFVKIYLDPSLDTSGIEEDPDLVVDSVCDIWPGAEWNERETYDMYGIRFTNHPDLRRILTWEKFPAHPLRKDYPIHGRGERESYRVLDRDAS